MPQIKNLVPKELYEQIQSSTEKETANFSDMDTPYGNQARRHRFGRKKKVSPIGDTSEEKTENDYAG